MTQSQATSKLESAGFTVIITEEPSKDMEKGKVTKQSTSGSTVTLTISSGSGSNNAVPGGSENN